LGVNFASEEEVNKAFSAFKDLADKKHDIYDEDLFALVSGEDAAFDEKFKLVSMRVCSETGEKPHAELVLSIDGQEYKTSSTGGGPVDAAFQAIEKTVNSETKLQLYSVNSITSGTDAQGEVTVRLEKDGNIVNGNGADTDIVVASVKAYLNSLNKINASADRQHPQYSPV
jgi:2-isopropylmalate synthase